MRRGLWLALLVGCAGGEEEPELSACEGSGDPSVELGKGSVENFTTFADGDSIPIQQNGTQYGFFFNVLTSGLDTTESVQFYVRLELDGGASDDFGATLSLQCDEEIGMGWAQIFTPYTDWASEAEAMAVDGTEVLATGTVTDDAGKVDSQAVSLEAWWPSSQ